MPAYHFHRYQQKARNKKVWLKLKMKSTHAKLLRDRSLIPIH